MSFDRIGVVGGGAWGTALAQVAASCGRETLLWALEDEVVAAVNGRHENTLFLPGVALNEAIRATSNLEDLSECDGWLVVDCDSCCGASGTSTMNRAPTGKFSSTRMEP